MPEMFEDWLQHTQLAEEQRMKTQGKESGDFGGLGRDEGDAEAWQQWRSYIDDLNDPEVDDVTQSPRGSQPEGDDDNEEE